MGALCSSDDVSYEMKPGVEGQDEIAETIFEKHLDLSPGDLSKFYRIFVKLEQIESDARDKNRQVKIRVKRKQYGDDFDETTVPYEEFTEGEVLKETLYEYFDIPRTVINRRVFGFFEDKDCSGKITFLLFVASLWNFLSFNVKWLGLFLYSIFNDKNTVSITHNQLISLVNTILERVAEPAVVRKLVNSVYRLPSEVTHVVYQKFILDNPIVFKPFQTLQEKLRTKCLGFKFWKRKQVLRLKNKKQMCTDFLVQINEINIELHMQRDMAAEVEERVAEWKRYRDAQKSQEQHGTDESTSPIPGTWDPGAVPPPSLKVYLVPGPDGGFVKTMRPKRKRKRHTRRGSKKQEELGPYGGPAEWLGREEQPEVDISPEVLAALEKKNAEKEALKQKRKALRARGARIAGELTEEENKKILEKPKLKYLPPIKHPGDQKKSYRERFGLESSWVSYVDKL